MSLDETRHAVKDYVVFQVGYVHSHTQYMMIIIMNRGMNC